MRPSVRLLVVIGLLVVALGGVRGAAAAPRGIQPEPARVTDVQDTSFVITWTTDVPTMGAVAISTNEEMSDPARSDEGTGPSRAHRVTITNLAPETTYYFLTISDSVSDGPYEGTTGPTLDFPAQPNSVSGRVLEKGSGQVLPDRALVYVRVIDDDGEDSADGSDWVSGITDNAGTFYVLLTVRTEDDQAVFEFQPDGDRLELYANGGVYGEGGRRVDAEVTAQGGAPSSVELQIESDESTPVVASTPTRTVTPPASPTPMPSPTRPPVPPSPTRPPTITPMPSPTPPPIPTPVPPPSPTRPVVIAQPTPPPIQIPPSPTPPEIEPAPEQPTPFVPPDEGEPPPDDGYPVEPTAAVEPPLEPTAELPPDGENTPEPGEPTAVQPIGEPTAPLGEPTSPAVEPVEPSPGDAGGPSIRPTRQSGGFHEAQPSPGSPSPSPVLAQVDDDVTPRAGETPTATGTPVAVTVVAPTTIPQSIVIALVLGLVLVLGGIVVTIAGLLGGLGSR